MMSNEKGGGGHGERSVAVGTLAKAIWDAVAKIADKPLFEILAERHGGVPDRGVFVYAAGGYYYQGKDLPRCALRCAVISTAGIQSAR
jgi:L-alanine-DL-glutamate epimerase-like enolase superfamily enzyme